MDDLDALFQEFHEQGEYLKWLAVVTATYYMYKHADDSHWCFMFGSRLHSSFRQTAQCEHLKRLLDKYNTSRSWWNCSRDSNLVKLRRELKQYNQQHYELLSRNFDNKRASFEKWQIK